MFFGVQGVVWDCTTLRRGSFRSCGCAFAPRGRRVDPSGSTRGVRSDRCGRMSDRRASFLDRLLAVVLRPVLAVVVRRFLLRQPRPVHDDRAVVGGPYPIRVLVFGAGMAVGYGADGRVPSLSRQLADALAVQMGRGVVVESRAQASVRLERSLDSIGMRGAATFDVVVWSPTLEEIFRGGSRRWRRELRSIVEHLRRTGRSHVRVLLMGVPAAEGDHPLQRSGRVLADSVNLCISQVAAMFERVEYLPVPSRLIDSTNTPLFDPVYQAEVVTSVAELIGLMTRPSPSPVRDSRSDGRTAAR